MIPAATWLWEMGARVDSGERARLFRDACDDDDFDMAEWLLDHEPDGADDCHALIGLCFAGFEAAMCSAPGRAKLFWDRMQREVLALYDRVGDALDYSAHPNRGARKLLMSLNVPKRFG